MKMQLAITHFLEQVEATQATEASVPPDWPDRLADATVPIPCAGWDWNYIELRTEAEVVARWFPESWTE